MDAIQKTLIKAGRKDLAQKYYKKIKSAKEKPENDPWGVRRELSSRLNKLAEDLNDVEFSESLMFYEKRGKSYVKKVVNFLNTTEKSIDALEKQIKKGQSI